MGSRYRGTKEEVRALSAYITLMRAADSLTDRTHAGLERRGLTASQLGVLEALHHCGAMCQSALAGKLLRSGASITVMLDHLESRGLVARVRSREDRRFVTVGLSAKGKALIERIFPEHAREITSAFKTLSAAEQEQLRVLCRKLGVGCCDKGGEAI